MTLASIGIQISDFEIWMTGESHTFDPVDQNTHLIAGMLTAMQRDDMISVVSRVANHAIRESWEKDRICRFLALAPETTAVWEIVRNLGNEIEQQYWRVCRGNIHRHEDETEFQFGLRRLLDAKRPLTALSMCYGDFNTVNPEVIAEILEGVLRNDQPDGPRFQSYVIREAIKRLEESSSIERSRLIRLEFGLIPAFGYEGEDGAKSLYRAIMSDPTLFVELLCLIYKPKNRTEDEPIDEFKKNAANTAWRVFHSCRVQPGTGEDGNIDASKFHLFVREVRQLALEADRLEACDSTLGEIFAYAPADTDGVWPCLPIRDVLDRPEHEAMRSGFRTGVYNKRGVHSRGALDGGDQEREIEERYRGYARVLHNSHPLLAATLDQIAETYKRDGISHDLSARLRREEH